MQIMGVAMVRADPKGTPPQPVRPASTAGVRSLAREPLVRKRAASPPAFAGEGAEARGLGRSHTVTLEKGRGSMFHSPFPIPAFDRSEAHTSDLQSPMRSSYADFCLKTKKH